MRKRKIGAVLLAVTMLAGILGGCGDKSTTSPADTDTGNTVTTSGTAEGAGDTDNAPSNNGEVVELTFFNADGNQEDRSCSASHHGKDRRKIKDDLSDWRQ